jgi:hypothetical protein
MSFLDDIISVGSSIYKSVSGSNIGSSLVRTAALGVILNQVSKSVNKENSKPNAANTTQPDRFVREQLSPDTNHSIPVIYGSAFIKGIITDAVLENSNTMWYCITICEKTGTLLSNSADSVISFNEIYLNQGKIAFQSDGFTVASTTSDDGVVDTQMAGLIKIYCFNNGSSSPVLPDGYTNPNVLYASGLFPNWTSNHTMNNLAFAIVRIEYNKDNNVTSLGEIEFKLTNTLSLPGDVVYDYMTNTRYGAGIPAEEIYSV